MTRDEIIQAAIYSDLYSSLSYADIELLSILRLDWKRCKEGKDVLEHEFTYCDSSSHVYVETDLLVVSDYKELSIWSHAFLYRETTLLTLDNSFGIPDGFNDYASIQLRLEEDLPAGVEDILINNIKSGEETFIRLVSRQSDPDVFIKNIKSVAIKKLLSKRWKAEKVNWL